MEHSYDALGVAGLYQMTLDARTWTLTRTAADFTPLEFSRRYTGTIRDDGRTITGYRQSTPNDSDRRKDLDLVYRREIDWMVPEVGQLGSAQHGDENV